jgi:hypothetical protein
MNTNILRRDMNITGNIILIKRNIGLIFTCSIDSTYFPFDTQVCTCSLLVWGFDIDEVELHKSQTTIDTDVYQGNSEWGGL